MKDKIKRRDISNIMQKMTVLPQYILWLVGFPFVYLLLSISAYATYTTHITKTTLPEGDSLQANSSFFSSDSLASQKPNHSVQSTYPTQASVVSQFVLLRRINSFCNIL